jgi:endonuclease/exonuclease/phosphatase family metal-dependent hydrolase
VLAYNVHHGEGMDDRLDLERIAALISEVDPDLVTLQEIDSVTSRTDGVDQAAELARLTGLRAVFGRFMPYQGGAYGMALLSRWPISESANHRLPDGAEPRSAVTATVRSPTTGRGLRLVGIHFYRTAVERLAQATTLESLLGEDTIPTILAGDFNSTPDSEVMVHLSKGWEVIGKGADHLTFPSYGPEREIDFVLLQPRDRFEVVSQRLLDEPVASDHRPVLVDIIYRD